MGKNMPELGFYNYIEILKLQHMKIIKHNKKFTWSTALFGVVISEPETYAVAIYENEECWSMYHCSWCVDSPHGQHCVLFKNLKFSSIKSQQT